MSYEMKPLADGTQAILLRGKIVGSAESYRRACEKIARFKRRGMGRRRRKFAPHRAEATSRIRTRE